MDLDLPRVRRTQAAAAAPLASASVDNQRRPAPPASFKVMTRGAAYQGSTWMTSRCWSQESHSQSSRVYSSFSPSQRVWRATTASGSAN